METITDAVTNVATVASRAIWGEGANPDDKKNADDTATGTGSETVGKEPVSGELGDVKSGEPYDKGNVDDNTTTGPAKSTLTSNLKSATTKPTSDSAAGAVLLPESSSTSRDTPTNLLTTATNEKSTKLPSETSNIEALTFSKSDPAHKKDAGSGVPGTESLEEKASAMKGATGYTPPALTGAPRTKNEGLREENVGSTGLLEEKRIKPESASEPKIGETSVSTAATPKKSSEPKKSLDTSPGAEGGEKEKKSLKEKIKEKLHRHKD